MARVEKSVNALLALLEDNVFRRWRPHLEVVELPLGKVIYEPGAVLDHVYFPTTAIVSLLYVKNGASAEIAEIAVIGKDGMVGVSLFMGGGARRSAVRSSGARAPAIACRPSWLPSSNAAGPSCI